MIRKMKAASLALLLTIASIITNAQISKADSFFSVGNYRMAKQVYQSTLKDTTRNPLAWNRLGFSNYNVKSYDEALRCFEKSLSQTPPPQLKVIVYSRIARVYAVQNDITKTFIAFDSAVNLQYSNVKEMDTLAEYNKVRSQAYFKRLREQVYINANPCMADPHHREFDFWVGEWEVFPTGVKPAGPGAKSVIQIISGGCAILENWESPNSNGKSINFIDPVSNKWKQSWSGSYANGSQEFTNGEYRDSAMHFDFETKDAQGNKIIGHFIFYNQGPNQVRQFSETSIDGGKIWTTNYDLTYIRKK